MPSIAQCFSSSPASGALAPLSGQAVRYAVCCASTGPIGAAAALFKCKRDAWMSVRAAAALAAVPVMCSRRRGDARPLAVHEHMLASGKSYVLAAAVALRVGALRRAGHSALGVAFDRVLQAAAPPSGGGKGPGSASGPGGKDSNGSGGGGGSGSEGNVPPIDDERDPEQWLVPRTVLFVLVTFAVTLVLYRLSRPNGRHVGWHSLNEHAGEVNTVALYNNYAQVYLDKEKVYLGLVHDQDTQKHMEELADRYRTARSEERTHPHAAAKDSTDGAKNGSGTEAHSTASQAQTPASAIPVAMTSLASLAPTVAGPTPAQKPDELNIVMKGAPVAENALVAVGVFAWVVPFVFFPVFVMFLSQYIGKSMASLSNVAKEKSKVKEMIFKVESSSSTRFRDIAGMKEPKKEITEIVDFLRHPERYTKLGAKIPTGAMLLGPPGTGKTLLAKAVAGESGVGFIPVAGSDFVELYVGMGALRVRQLFKEARKQRCIIYIDEIDAIGLKRQGAGHGEKQEQEQTLNELLTQLDGFSTSKRGDIMVLASSNVAQEALDPALIRPGRFDRIIHVDTPVIAERIDIFKVHLSKLKLVSTEEEDKAAAAAADADKKAEPEADASTEGAAAKAAPVQVAAALAGGEGTKDGLAAQEDSKDAPLAPDATSSGAPAARDTAASEPHSTETQMVLSELAKEKLGDAAVLAEERDGHFSFDFRSLLMKKSDAERALIDAYAGRMSNLCPGFVGADIANVCNEGAILAAREGCAHVDVKHLERSIDRVLAGIEHRSRVLSPFEKNVVAHHEAGHAVAGWFLNRADPLMKVSIVPRGGSALGYAQYLPNENYARTAQEIRDSISVTLGGRVAEEIFFQHLSTGASDDLRKVGQMAYLYVSSFSPGSVYPAPGTSATRLMKPFGATRSNALDRRAKTLVDEVYTSTVALLREHKDDMERLAQHLLKHEMLTFQDVVNYLGPRSARGRDKVKGV